MRLACQIWDLFAPPLVALCRERITSSRASHPTTKGVN